MEQGRDPLLGHFCRSLNENVTRVVLIKSCAERSLDHGVKRAPIVMRIRSSPIINWRVLGRPASNQCYSVFEEG
jgi:hypothetical protein